jgi:hypothetical protein
MLLRRILALLPRPMRLDSKPEAKAELADIPDNNCEPT